MTERYVLTGAPGAGKTPVLAELIRRGCVGVPEPAREVLAEQRATGGAGVPERDRVLFNTLMLDRAVSDFKRHDAGFFDRGIVDLVAYAEIFEIDASAAWDAARTHRYDDPVFVFPSWEEIYTTDDERTMTFEFAKAFGDRIREVYEALGYKIVEVPCESPAARAAYLLAKAG